MPGELSEDENEPDEHGYPEDGEDRPRTNRDHAHLGRRHGRLFGARRGLPGEYALSPTLNGS